MSEKRLLQKVAANDMPSAATWRSGWDSNPRALADNLISSVLLPTHFSGKSPFLMPYIRS